MRNGSIGLRVATLLLLATQAFALPLTIYEDVDLSGDYNAGEERSGATHGTGGATYNWAFDLDAAIHDLVTTVIQIVLDTYDHNWRITLNGVVIIPLDPGDPAVFSPAVQTPWTANSNGLPRLVMDIASGAIGFAGTLTTGSTSLTSGLVYNQAVVLPIFQDGQNTFQILNPNSTGPDGMDFSVSGSVGALPVPEPSGALLVLLGLAGLGYLGRSRRT